MLNKIFSDILKNQKQVIIIIAIAVLLALFLYITFIFSPQIVKIVGLSGKLAKARINLRGAESIIAKMDGMKAAIEVYKAKVGKYEKMLPTEEGIPSLLESLSEMAKSSSMSIAGIAPFTPNDSKPQGPVYKELPIMINAKAGYHELGRFMASLENSDRFIKIADMQIKFNKATPNKHDIELLVVTYVLLEGK